MFNKAKKITGNITDPSNYIEGVDIYNSKFLSMISDPSITRVLIEIDVNEYRPDLIARDFYGSSEYMGILLLQTKMTLGNFKKGTILSLIPKIIIDNIIKSI